jgi:hypothetical protein
MHIIEIDSFEPIPPLLEPTSDEAGLAGQRHLLIELNLARESPGLARTAHDAEGISVDPQSWTGCPPPEPLPIYSDEREKPDRLHVDDNIPGILGVLEHGRIGEVPNIGGLENKENLTFTCKLIQLLEKPECLLNYVKGRQEHDRRYGLRCNKMGKDLG